MTPDEIILKIGTSTEILEFGTTPVRAFVLIGQLQLALRYPHNTGASAALAREIAEHLTDAICHYIPEARELIEQGWNPAYDVTRDYYRSEFCDEPGERAVDPPFRGLPFMPSEYDLDAIDDDDEGDFYD